MVSNLNDLKMHIDHRNGDEVTMIFKSDYSVSGNTVTVIIEEFYKELNYPTEEFPDFRAVINAAADFNKKVLVLERSL